MANKDSQNPILVPIDFSSHSRAALLFASALATKLKVPLTVLHVVHDPGNAPGFYVEKNKGKRFRKMEDIAEDKMKSFLQKICKSNELVKPLKNAKTILVTGLPVTRILQVVEKIEPCSVVMGSKGRTGLAHILLGSKAEQVVRLCPKPVTIVKDQKETKKK